MENPLKALAEKYYGEVIPEQEYREALISAERKLRWIISREGDANGERRKPYYIAQLISEAVSASRFSAFTLQCCKLTQYIKDHEAEIIEEIRKGQSVPLTQDRPAYGISVVSSKS